MTKGWQLKLIQPQEILRAHVNKAWQMSLKELKRWMEKDLVNAMVYGGLGLQGIAETEFYRFVSSADGLSQLGIEKNQPPKLLKAYVDTVKISIDKSSIVISFGDIIKLKTATPHPAAGTGHLEIRSWLEWAFDGDRVNSGFVPRENLAKDARKSIRIKSAPGGLMLPKGVAGSTGLWRFPDHLIQFEKRWLEGNLGKIEKLVQDQAIVFLNKALS